MADPPLPCQCRRPRSDDGGYAMAALLVALTVMSLMLSMAMPVWRTAAKRERETELVFRGEQYAHAIELFSRRNGGFPTSLEMLRAGRYIRKLYKDPITDGDFQPVFLGQVAIPTSGSAVPGGPSAPLSLPGGARGREGGGGLGQTPAGGRSGQSPFGSSAQSGAQSGAITAGPIIGVVSKSKAESLRQYNGRGHYNEWMFVSTAATRQAGAPGGAPGAQTPGQQPGRGGRAIGPGGRGGALPGAPGSSPFGRQGGPGGFPPPAGPIQPGPQRGRP